MTFGKFTYPFRYSPVPEVKEAASRVMAHIDASPRLREIFSEGKMLGVLTVAVDDTVSGKVPAFRQPDMNLLHRLPDGTAYLVAFSGNVGGANLIDGFVPPIFDLLDPEGHFKAEEKRITDINREISLLSEGRISPDAYHGNGTEDRIRRLKEERKRMSDNLQKWIFSRYVVRNGKGEERNILDIFADHGLVPPGGTGDCAAPKLLQYAYSHGLRPVSMGEFWYGGPAGTESLRIPGNIRNGNGKKKGEFYPSCSSKCGPLLRWMLKGVDMDNPYEFDNDTVPEILWEDDSLMIVNKPAGMLCAPGKDGQTSLIERLPQPAYSVHRLDMDTSGVLIVARTLRAQATLQKQFEDRKVRKTYVALVENRAGLHPGDTGTVSLPLRPDIDDRPRQIVDFEHGREAVTDYTVLDILTPDGKPDNVPAGNAGDPSRFTGPFPFREPMSPASPTGTDTGSSSYRTPDKKDCKAKPDNGTGPDSRPELALMEFRPFTGRTHQLRVHAATGLGCPIFGDLLYGGGWHRRMCLHAARINFDHPLTGERLTFTVPPGF